MSDRLWFLQNLTFKFDFSVDGSSVCFRSNSEHIPTAEGMTRIDVTALSVTSDDVREKIFVLLILPELNEDWTHRSHLRLP